MVIHCNEAHSVYVLIRYIAFISDASYEYSSLLEEDGVSHASLIFIMK